MDEPTTSAASNYRLKRIMVVVLGGSTGKLSYLSFRGSGKRIAAPCRSGMNVSGGYREKKLLVRILFASPQAYKHIRGLSGNPVNSTSSASHGRVLTCRLLCQEQCVPDEEECPVAAALRVACLVFVTPLWSFSLLLNKE